MRRTISGLILALALIVVQASAALALEMPGQAEPGDTFGLAQATGDFDGDGLDDLAVGMPGEAIGTLSSAGGVDVTYGSANGLTASGAQLWTQDEAGIAGVAETGDRFGEAIGAGDFNSDGFDDLAVGAPSEDLSGQTNAGAVHVIYGSANGLTSSGNDVFDQGSLGRDIEDFDRFGSSLAAGNFGNSTHGDLAIGVPAESLDGVPGVGAVHAIYGSASGLSTSGNDFMHQQLLEIEGDAEAHDHFGSALAAANFGNSTHADLAVGVPDESVSGEDDAGAINVIYGATGGLTTAGDRFLHQGISGLEGGLESNDGFGFALAAANYGKTSQADLAVGAPFEDVGDENGAGAVNILYGSSTGITVSGDALFSQEGSIEGGPESTDNFGYSLAAGNLGHSAEADLAVGVRGEVLEDITSAGVVNVIFGSSGGLAVAGDELWDQDATGIEGDGAQAFDHFGWTVAAGNFGNGTHADLAVGVPLEDVGTPVISNAGAVNVIYGASDGLTNTGDQFWTQGIP
jgi:FG-GAP repeat